jgi:subtilisin family serine protease
VLDPRARALSLIAGLVAALAPGLVPAAASAVTADDPLAAESWQLQGDGPMGVASAWARSTGGDVVVAVVDSGIDLGHPDLRDNLWTNPGEIPANGVDDDRDGIVDDVHGADLVNGDGTPTDDNGHGTHVAGIIGARGGNGIGTAGVAWRVRLMAVKVLDARAAGAAETVADGVDYAVAHGARIVNLSLAGPGRSADLERAISAARDRGVLVVCAAGNDHRDLGLLPSYPASLPQDNVLGVAATAPGGVLAAISSFGAGVDLAAPGQEIISTAADGGYEMRTGTSMAAPMVAGAAALVAGVLPGAGARELAAALVGTATPSALPIGAGRLNVGAALRAAAPGGVVSAKAAKRKVVRKMARKRRATTKATVRTRTVRRKAPSRRAKARAATAPVIYRAA